MATGSAHSDRLPAGSAGRLFGRARFDYLTR